MTDARNIVRREGELLAAIWTSIVEVYQAGDREAKRDSVILALDRYTEFVAARAVRSAHSRMRNRIVADIERSLYDLSTTLCKEERDGLRIAARIAREAEPPA